MPDYLALADLLSEADPDALAVITDAVRHYVTNVLPDDAWCTAHHHQVAAVVLDAVELVNVGVL